MYSIDLTALFGQAAIDRLLGLVQAIETMKPIDLLLVLTAFNFDLFMSGYVALMLLTQILQPVFIAFHLMLFIGLVH